MHAAVIDEKVLICGIARNIEKAIPNTIESIGKLGSNFSDYRVIIYENNSSDKTKEKFKKWAKKDRRVIFISEYVSKKKMAKQLSMGIVNRTELIARARNIVLDKAMSKKFDDYKYVIWADLDFLEPWDVEHIVESITHPEKEWDAVFAYGAYDLFALRTEEWPVGFELVGLHYWDQLDQIRNEFVLQKEDPWKKVYSAFGGIGIYKRDAIKGCRYSGVVTNDLEKVTARWLEKARDKKGVIFLDKYDELLLNEKIVELDGSIVQKKEEYPDPLGVRLKGGRLAWFSCTKNTTLPWVCEHIPFHALMVLNGHDRLYINPKIQCSP